MAKVLTICPDAKNRITLGSLAQGVSSFQASVDSSGRIILEPFAEIPAREKWLFENKGALGAVRDGLAQAAEGKTLSRGRFAKFTNGETD